MCGAELRRQLKRADVVEQDVVSHAESGSNRSVSAVSGRVSQADTRREVGLLRLRHIEGENTRHVGDAVLRLGMLAKGNASVLVANSEVHREIRLQTVVVIDVVIAGDLVPVIG